MNDIGVHTINYHKKYYVLCTCAHVHGDLSCHGSRGPSMQLQLISVNEYIGWVAWAFPSD